MVTVSIAASPLKLLLLVYLKVNEGDCTLTVSCVHEEYPEICCGPVLLHFSLLLASRSWRVPMSEPYMW